MYPLLDATLSTNFIVAVKVALEAAGFPIGGPREPFLPLDDETASRIADLASAFRA